MGERARRVAKFMHEREVFTETAIAQSSGLSQREVRLLLDQGARRGMVERLEPRPKTSSCQPPRHDRREIAERNRDAAWRLTALGLEQARQKALETTQRIALKGDTAAQSVAAARQLTHDALLQLDELSRDGRQLDLKEANQRIAEVRRSLTDAQSSLLESEISRPRTEEAGSLAAALTGKFAAKLLVKTALAPRRASRAARALVR